MLLHHYLDKFSGTIAYDYIILVHAEILAGEQRIHIHA